MSEVKSWSVTAANNNSAAPDGWPENMAYSAVNNAARELMAAVVRWHDDMDGELVSTGSSNAYVLTPNVTYSAYEAGMSFLFLANHANTGAATLNVSALGAKDLRDGQGAALASGAIGARQPLLAVYDATNGYFRAFGAGFLRQSGGTVTGNITLDKTASATPAQIIINSQTGYDSVVTHQVNSVGRAAAGVEADDGSYGITVRDAAGANAQVAISAIHDGASKLAYAGSNKVVTTSTGATVTGSIVETVQFVSATNGGSTSMSNGTRLLTLTHGSTIAGYTIGLPDAPVNGQVVRIASRSAVSALVIVAMGSGDGMATTITTIAAGGFAEWVYQASGQLWHRCG